MIPGLGGMNPAKMAGLMKKMGIQQIEVDAERVVIEKTDGGKIVINNPEIMKVKMAGNESFQITGDISEKESESVNEEDVKLVMEKTGKDEGEVRKVLEELNGDIAEAIVRLGE